MISLLVYLPVLALPLLGIRRGLSAQLLLAAAGWLILGLVQGVMTTGFGERLISTLLSARTSLHDTYYVVSHFQYTLGIAAVFVLLALLARLRRPGGHAGLVAFWTMHIGIALTILPQQAAGLMLSPGANTFDLARRFETINLVTTIASVVALLSFACLFAILVFGAIRRLSGR